MPPLPAVDYLSKLEIWIVVLLFVLVFEATKIQEKEHPKSGGGRSGHDGMMTQQLIGEEVWWPRY